MLRYILTMILHAQPARPLRQFVRNYVHLEARLPDSILFWPIPARSATCIEFTFGNPYRIHHVDGCLLETTYPSTLIGAKTYQRIRLELQGHVETFVIVFQASGLQRLFSLPAGEIVNEHYEAHAVLGRTITDLRSRLEGARSFWERVRIADDFLTTRIAEPSRPVGVEAAAQEIVSNRGCVRIPDLARHIGLSLRQFERRFASDLGITPKLYARIVRFETAIGKRAASPTSSWTAIAHELGYHDQMHMIHDFHRLSGESPTSLTKHLDILSSMAAQSRS